MVAESGSETHRGQPVMEMGMGSGLLDLGGYPDIHCAGVGATLDLRDGRAKFLMVDWHIIDGVWRRKIVGSVTRPIETMKLDRLVIDAVLFPSGRASTAEVQKLH